MTRMSWLATAAATALFVAGLSAQGKPDFSGKWTQVQDPAAAAAPAGGPGGGGGRGGGRGGGGFCGAECTIAQDATTLTVTRTTPAGETKAMYKLDGSDSKNMQAGRGGETEVVSKAMWDGAKLAISTTRPGRDGGAPITQKTVVGLNAGQMEVENIVEGAPAGGPPGGGAPAKLVYKKN